MAMAALSGEKTRRSLRILALTPPTAAVYRCVSPRIEQGRVAPIGYQLLDQLGARGLVLDQQHAGGEPVALLAHRALERWVFEPLE